MIQVMDKETTKNMLQTAFAELGAEMKKDSCGLFIVKYDSMEYFLDLDEKDGTFCILQTVMGLDRALTQKEFDTMLDVVRSFHNEYDGVWNGGVSYLHSPCYSIRESHGFSSKSLEKIVKDFFEAWSFACANACMLTDASIWE